MGAISIALYAAVTIYAIDSLLELAFISSMVAWLHTTAGGQWFVRDGSGGTFSLHGKPLNLLLNQGHTSNGAAGTGFIVIGLGGALALGLRSRQLRRNGYLSGFTKGLYYFWLTFTLLSALFTLSALIAVFVITYSHDHQSINVGYASTLNNRRYPNYVAYDKLEWTPQNWFPAVLKLDLVSDSARSDIEQHLTIMKAWQWNLIPMSVLGLITTAIAFMERMTMKQHESRVSGSERLRQKVDA